MLPLVVSVFSFRAVPLLHSFQQLLASLCPCCCPHSCCSCLPSHGLLAQPTSKVWLQMGWKDSQMDSPLLLLDAQITLVSTSLPLHCVSLAMIHALQDPCSTQPHPSPTSSISTAAGMKAPIPHPTHDSAPGQPVLFTLAVQQAASFPPSTLTFSTEQSSTAPRGACISFSCSLLSHHVGPIFLYFLAELR